MPVPVKLDPAALTSALATLREWRHDAAAGSVARKFVFQDFQQAFAFMTAMALWSEQHDHHPDWHNVYNTVDVVLTTHDCAGLSQHDIEWARQADRAWQRQQG